MRSMVRRSVTCAHCDQKFDDPTQEQVVDALRLIAQNILDSDCLHKVSYNVGALLSLSHHLDGMCIECSAAFTALGAGLLVDVMGQKQ